YESVIGEDVLDTGRGEATVVAFVGGDSSVDDRWIGIEEERRVEVGGVEDEGVAAGRAGSFGLPAGCAGEPESRQWLREKRGRVSLAGPFGDDEGVDIMKG